MKYRIDHDLHIHSCLSSCSNDPLQSTETILQNAVDHGLSTLCVTDHFWDPTVAGASDWYAPQNLAHIQQNLPLPTHKGIRFLFGCETELDANLTLGITPETARALDFVIIPLNHFHMQGYTIHPHASAQECADAFLQRLEFVLSCNLPFRKIGIAHPACSLMAEKGRTQDVLARMDKPCLRDLFAQMAQVGMGLEINGFDVDFDTQSTERIQSTLSLYDLAKEAHCTFYLGSDAHHPDELRHANDVFEKAVDLLGLEEKDQFCLE